MKFLIEVPNDVVEEFLTGLRLNEVISGWVKKIPTDPISDDDLHDAAHKIVSQQCLKACSRGHIEAYPQMKWAAMSIAEALLKLEAPELVNDGLLAALEEAKQVIKTWHMPAGWEIYDRCSPEMKLINAAIARGKAGLA